jgi:hypothetical protein
MGINGICLIAIGLTALWSGYRNNEEVHRLALASTGVLSLFWGFSAISEPFQLMLGAFCLSLYKFWQNRG